MKDRNLPRDPEPSTDISSLCTTDEIYLEGKREDLRSQRARREGLNIHMYTYGVVLALHVVTVLVSAAVVLVGLFVSDVLVLAGLAALSGACAAGVPLWRAFGRFLRVL